MRVQKLLGSILLISVLYGNNDLAEQYFNEGLKYKKEGNYKVAYDYFSKSLNLNHKSAFYEMKTTNILLEEQERKKYNKIFDYSFEQLKDMYPNHYDALRVFYPNMYDFIKLKLENETVFHGSGWAEDFNLYIDRSNSKLETLIISIINKVFTPDHLSYEIVDKKLNSNYKKLMLYMKNDPFSYKYPYPQYVVNIKYDGVKITQRSWIKFRDSFSEYLTTLDYKYNTNFWKAYLTDLRNKDLEYLLNLDDLITNELKNND